MLIIVLQYFFRFQTLRFPGRIIGNIFRQKHSHKIPGIRLILLLINLNIPAQFIFIYIATYQVSLWGKLFCCPSHLTDTETGSN